MAEDELFDAKDLADIFGVADEKSGGDDLGKSLEDLFFSDDEDEGGGGLAAAAAGLKEAPELPSTPGAPPPPPPPIEELEPEPAEPDRGGLTEEEWRASPAYSEFKRQVIARHLKKKALQDAQARQAAEAEARAQLEAEAAAKAAAEAAAAAAQGEAQKKASEEAEKRKQELLEKYKAAKAATIAQRAQAMIQAGEAEQPKAGEEKAKEDQFKAYLAQMKGKMAAGALPKLALSSKQIEPKLSDAAKGLQIDVLKAKVLAAMFEATRLELYKLVSEAIGKKPAQAMMKKTLAKVAKTHLDVFGRAALDPNNELRVDGALDEDKLARAIYALPEGLRLAKVQKAFYELTELRFIAVELGLGIKQKNIVVSKLLDILEGTFKAKGATPELQKWYMDDVIPSTSLSDSDEG